MSIPVLPDIYPVACHTDHVGPGSTFVAIKGSAFDGVSFISSALEKGATRIVVEKDACLSQSILDLIYERGAVLELVSNARKALAILSAQAALFPATKLKIIAVTGTKGKTTTVYLLAHILKEAGYKVAYLSTVANAIDGHCFPAHLTTAQPDYTHQFLKTCVEYGIDWVIMEVAAQAVSLHRIEGILFDAVLITNIAREHLEFYPSLDAYIQAKFDLLVFRKKGAPAWCNKDDKYLSGISAEDVQWFSMLYGTASLYGVLEKNESTQCIVVAHDTQRYILSCHALWGTYNVYNVLAALGGALHAGVSWDVLRTAISKFPGVPGRFERYILPNGATAIIDYAHNPLSYQAILSTLRTQTDQLIVVFGAGGERDPGRRPEMGRIVAEYADLAFITTDNPRSENPLHIAQNIIEGVDQSKSNKFVIELDRELAIVRAYQASRAGALVVLLGKGVEEYQIIGKTKLPFSERKIIENLVVFKDIKVAKSIYKRGSSDKLE